MVSQHICFDVQPLALAMKLLAGSEDALLAAPFEVQQMAREVAERLRA